MTTQEVAHQAQNDRSPEARGGTTVLKNTALFLGAQVLVAPLSLVTSVLVVRGLGPTELGLQYLASTFVGFAVQFAEWGQSAPLTAAVARDRAGSGGWVSSGIAGRLLGLSLAGPCMLGVAALFGREDRLLLVAALAFVAAALGLLSAACADAIRGLERADVAAASWVALQLTTTCSTLLVLALGGRLLQLLIVSIAIQGVALLVSLWLLRRLGVAGGNATRAAMRKLWVEGAPFVTFGLILALQPNVEAFVMSRVASPEAIGWYASARRLLGPLSVPAAALVSALYPTLCRLTPAGDEFLAVARAALGNVALVAMPLALGCAFFPDIPTLVFGREKFAGAEPVIRLFGPLLLLLYVTMPVGSCLAASGRQRAWTAVQLGSVVVSLFACPLLTAYFQTQVANGGVGAALAAILNELFTLVGALWIAPRGLLTRSLAKKLAAVALAGLGMALAAWSCAKLGPWIAAPLAVLAYGICALATGALGARERSAVRALVLRRRSR